MITKTQLQSILNDITIFDRTFEIADAAAYSATGREGGWLVRVVYDEPDIKTGVPETQRARRWFISENETVDDVINTVFAAVMRSYDHVVREHFTYKGQRVFSPHFPIADRLALAAKGDV